LVSIVAKHQRTEAYIQYSLLTRDYNALF